MDPQSRPHDETPVPKGLVKAAIGGDRGALRQIYERTCGRIFRLMVRMVGRQDGEDLTQQVYVRAFENLDQFEGSAKFETWLYRIATNEALQHLRRERVRKTVPIEADPAARVDKTVEHAETAQRLQSALSQLDDELRTIISLKEESGLSYKQISETMGIPAGTVGSRLNRARRELGKLLDEESVK